jgi:hypothetical protein
MMPGDAAKPGVIPLRPLTVGEILSGAVSTMLRHAGLMFGVSAVVAVISQLLILAATYPLLDNVNNPLVITPATPASEVTRYVTALLAYDGITALVSLPARIFLAGFLTVVVAKAVLGQSIGFGEVWTRVRPRLLALLGVTLVYPAIGAGAGAVLFLLSIAAPPLAILVTLVALPVGLWLLILFSLATPALMLEDAPIGRAFGRSRALVTGSWWRVLGIQLLTGIIAVVVTLIVTLPFGGLTQSTSASYLALSTIGAIIAATITEPLAAGVTVLIYTDQRIRRERMDLELAGTA